MAGDFLNLCNEYKMSCNLFLRAPLLTDY